MAKQPNSQKVTRIKASDDESKPKTTKVSSGKKSAAVSSRSKRSFGPFGPIFGYFRGAWAELRQVHWPTRRATWGLTGAVMLFTVFFVIFITALDALFKFVFEQILGN